MFAKMRIEARRGGEIIKIVTLYTSFTIGFACCGRLKCLECVRISYLQFLQSVFLEVRCKWRSSSVGGSYLFLFYFSRSTHDWAITFRFSLFFLLLPCPPVAGVLEVRLGDSRFSNVQTNTPGGGASTFTGLEGEGGGRGQWIFFCLPAGRIESGFDSLGR